MEWAEAVGAGTAIAAVSCFVVYLVGILRMPSGRRPLITPVDRLGNSLPRDENPDYRDTEDEEE